MSMKAVDETGGRDMWGLGGSFAACAAPSRVIQILGVILMWGGCGGVDHILDFLMKGSE